MFHKINLLLGFLSCLPCSRKFEKYVGDFGGKKDVCLGGIPVEFNSHICFFNTVGVYCQSS